MEELYFIEQSLDPLLNGDADNESDEDFFYVFDRFFSGNIFLLMAKLILD